MSSKRIFVGFVLILLFGCSAVLADGLQKTAAVVNPVYRSGQRDVIVLDGKWDFATDADKVGKEQKWFDPAVELPNKITIDVPGIWEAQGVGGLGDSRTNYGGTPVVQIKGTYTGAAWYKKEIAIPKGWAGKRVWLKIGGVHAQGWFWVNGTFVTHIKAYCGTFKCDITELVKPGEKCVIAGMVRNDVDTGRGSVTFMNMMGGLDRSIELEATSDIYVDYADVQGLFDEKAAKVNIKLGSAKKQARCEVEVRISTVKGKKAGSAVKTVSLSPESVKDLSIKIPLELFNAWSPSNPNLYKAEITLKVDGRKVDSWVERFGVKKFEVRGDKFYLNDKPFYSRGFGDDMMYLLTMSSPGDRAYHKKHLQLAKDYGFNYIRLHTHVEVPEYVEAADEVGLMLQLELPYNGRESYAVDKLSAESFRPKEELKEIMTHYRRYISFATITGGNEGYLGSPIDVEVYQLAKQLAPDKPFMHQDGGKNTKENSDFGTIWSPAGHVSHSTDFYGLPNAEIKDDMPYILHEYLNASTEEDPRISHKYTGAYFPFAPMDKFKDKLAKAGLSYDWGIKIQDAGHELQKIYHKRGIEAARLNPQVDGFVFWTIVDVGGDGPHHWGAQGLFNHFWEPKASTGKDFQQFNGNTTILTRLQPLSQILYEGQELSVEWWLSHFGSEPIKNGSLKWKLVSGFKTLASGKIETVNAEPGQVEVVDITKIKVPALKKGVKAKLIASLAGTEVSNSWDIWLFPKPKSKSAKGICASEAVYSVISQRYPGIVKLGSDEADKADVIITDTINEEVLNGLEEGKAVLLLDLIGPRPGRKLGWWWKTTGQSGTTVAKHEAFGDFPHQGYFNELFFRMVGSTIKLDGTAFKSVEPLMAGVGNDGYLLYVFQAKVGKGRLLGSGLDLLSEKPESTYLLDEFIKYVRSSSFKPKGSIELCQLKNKWGETAVKEAQMLKELNGCVDITYSSGRALRENVPLLGKAHMWLVRPTTEGGWDQRKMSWRTRPAPENVDPSKNYTFKWVASMGFISQPAGSFTLMLGDKKLLDFDVTIDNAAWADLVGTVKLKYEVIKKVGAEDCDGIMTLTVPGSMLTPGKPLELNVIGSDSNSNRWFGIYQYD